MKDAIVQILVAAMGSLGFSILLRLRPRRLPWATLGGGLTWTLYLLLTAQGLLPFFANLLSALAANLWAAVMSHRLKAPAVIFTITAVIPLIPGSGLFYTMSALVASNHAEAAAYGTATLLTAGAISLGTLIFTVLQHMFLQLRLNRRHKEA